MYIRQKIRSSRFYLEKQKQLVVRYSMAFEKFKLCEIIISVDVLFFPSYLMKKILLIYFSRSHNLFIYLFFSN